MSKHYDLNGKIAIVTGAGSGIGREVALVLAEEGAELSLMDLNKEGLAGTIRLLKEGQFSGDTYALNISDPDAVSKAFDQIEGKWSRVDILVTCAGIMSSERTWDISPESWKKVLDVNLMGTFLAVRCALKLMRKQKYGKIITIGSDVGKRGGGRMADSAYAASKGGVLAFTRTVAREVALDGISVNCVNPGPTRTPMHDDTPEEKIQLMRSGIPKGRLGKPRDIANAVAFLVSELAEHIHGETLNVDGGVMMD